MQYAEMPTVLTVHAASERCYSVMFLEKLDPWPPE